MAEKKRGLFYWFADSAPYISIGTGLIYMIVTFFNIVTNGALNNIQGGANWLLFYGAFLTLPLVVFDLLFTEYEPERDEDIVMAGFINYFALLVAYTRIDWGVVKPVIQWVMYTYLILFIIALGALLIGYAKIRLSSRG